MTQTCDTYKSRVTERTVIIARGAESSTRGMFEWLDLHPRRRGTEGCSFSKVPSFNCVLATSGPGLCLCRQLSGEISYSLVQGVKADTYLPHFLGTQGSKTAWGADIRSRGSLQPRWIPHVLQLMALQQSNRRCLPGSNLHKCKVKVSSLL